jgi:hypothetical protein
MPFLENRRSSGERHPTGNVPDAIVEDVAGQQQRCNFVLHCRVDEPGKHPPRRPRKATRQVRVAQRLRAQR